MFDINNLNPKYRTSEEWHEVFVHVMHELTEKFDTEFRFVKEKDFSDDIVGNSHASEATRIIGTSPGPLNIELCGLISVHIEFGEYSSIIAEVLLFTDGKRLTGKNKMDLICLEYRDNGWSDLRWDCDEHWEWDDDVTNVQWHMT